MRPKTMKLVVYSNMTDVSLWQYYVLQVCTWRRWESSINGRMMCERKKIFVPKFHFQVFVVCTITLLVARKSWSEDDATTTLFFGWFWPLFLSLSLSLSKECPRFLPWSNNARSNNLPESLKTDISHLALANKLFIFPSLPQKSHEISTKAKCRWRKCRFVTTNSQSE